MKKKSLAFMAIIVAIAFSVYSMSLHNEAKAEESVEKVSPQKEGMMKPIMVDMMNTKGEKIGEVRLEEAADGVHINLDASKLPQGTHGIHIHENGSCEAPTFESAGGHFNPTESQHGFDNPKGPHAGDLPNIQVKPYGLVSTVLVNNMVTLKKGEKNSLLKQGGTAIVIHEKADDNSSQPAGNAGKRIACGEIAE